ncbi:hypothetical protein DGMP_08080 [Desulfomarina profundi]|uniref:Uncharacterized protein n=1 Tax=Desulfomarina profundi TaxID=2772557 RepID=A0A8D5FGF5_9BACT|nr:hypothetical protein DGMP_08080 [Desulfomarina profundi]
MSIFKVGLRRFLGSFFMYCFLSGKLQQSQLNSFGFGVGGEELGVGGEGLEVDLLGDGNWQ